MDYHKGLAQAIQSACALDASDIANWIELPPNPQMGDFAFPCFRLAKTMKKAPNLIAEELQKRMVLPDFIERAETAGGYLNFFVRRQSYVRDVLGDVHTSGERYGSSDLGAGGNVCIDYSSINIAKPFHIGHLSSTAIGHALYRIYEFMGYRCIGINHLGDWGTQFGKLITAYLRWGDEEQVNRGSVSALLELYVKFHDEAEHDPALEDEARMWFKRIEDGNQEALRLFTWFKELTLKEVGRVYDMLGITFDSYAGESFYNDKMDRVVEELRQKQLLKLDQGAYIVDLEAYKMPPCIILRSDGATLYATRDIAAALYRKDTYDFVKCLYVVAYQQNLHFRQWFQVVELMGYDWAKDLEHVAFGMVSMQDGTLSTRKGKVVFLEDVLNKSVEKTLALIEEKSPHLEDKHAVAKQVGVGAVVWNALYNGRIKDIVFSYDKALNFDGETGPYVQYTHARCCSVLQKAAVNWSNVDYAALCDDAAFALVKAIGAFPQAVKDALTNNEPYLVSRAVMAVCQSFNKFYYDNRIMADEANVRNARLALTDAVRTLIKTGLYLIGLEAPERM